LWAAKKEGWWVVRREEGAHDGVDGFYFFFRWCMYVPGKDNLLARWLVVKVVNDDTVG
jgi:hypothetical protein